MPDQTYAQFRKNGDLLNKSLIASASEHPHLETPRTRLDAILTEVDSLSLQQAELTASKQEISKRLADLVNEGRRLMTFLRAGVRQHFGNRAERLLAFGLQPFRSRPRIKVVGPDGQPLKKSPEALGGEAPAETPNP